MSAIQKREKIRCRLWWVLVWLLCYLPAFVGCASNRPAGKAMAGATSVSQRGPAQVPAKAETVTTRATLPLPAGTRLEVFSPEPVSRKNETLYPAASALAVTLPSPAVLSVETVTERATAPQAFEPPAPPSPADLADGRAVWVYRLALVVGIAAALFGLVRGWDFVMYGGGAVAAAALVGLFVQKHPALLAVMGAGLALAVVGVVFWHWKLKPKANPFVASPS